MFPSYTQRHSTHQCCQCFYLQKKTKTVCFAAHPKAVCFKSKEFAVLLKKKMHISVVCSCHSQLVYPFRLKRLLKNVVCILIIRAKIACNEHFYQEYLKSLYLFICSRGLDFLPFLHARQRFWISFCISAQQSYSEKHFGLDHFSKGVARRGGLGKRQKPSYVKLPMPCSTASVLFAMVPFGGNTCHYLFFSLIFCFTFFFYAGKI